MRAAFVDTETTGFTLPSMVDLDKQPHIIELGLIVVENGKVIEELTIHELFNPGVPIPADATKVNGITDEMVANKPPFSSIVPRLADVLETCQLLVAHNADYDKSCIHYELMRLSQHDTFPWPPETMCTVQEYVHEFGKRPTLKDLYLRKTGKPLAQTHRALDDIMALVEVMLIEGIV